MIDLGSNTARLAVYRSAPVGPPWIVFESKENPRLAAGTDPQGRLTPDAQRKALETLDRFRLLLGERGVAEVNAAATGVIRDAPNRELFLLRVRRRTDVPLRIISARSEARYAYLGVASSLPLGNDLLMDLGGGTAQFIRVEHGRMRGTTSLPVGSLRLHTRFIHHDPPRRDELDDLGDFVARTLETTPILDTRQRLRIVGVGGTCRGLARIVQATREYPLTRVHGYVLHLRDLENLYEILSETSVEVRKEIPGMSGDRADIILAGVVVVRALLHQRDEESLVVSGCGIREGMAEELLHRRLPSSPEEMSTESALAAAWSFGTSDGHGRRVRSLALDLFECLKRTHGLGEEERLALGVGALLHDSGTIVAYPDHAQHSSYLVQHHPLYGLDHRGLLLAALSVATHEGGELPGKIIKGYRWVLDDADGDRVRRMGAMLALAEALAEGRPMATFARRAGALSIHLGAKGALSPRALDRAARSFRRTFGMEVRIHG